MTSMYISLRASKMSVKLTLKEDVVFPRARRLHLGPGMVVEHFLDFLVKFPNLEELKIENSVVRSDQEEQGLLYLRDRRISVHVVIDTAKLVYDPELLHQQWRREVASRAKRLVQGVQKYGQNLSWISEIK